MRHQSVYYFDDILGNGTVIHFPAAIIVVSRNIRSKGISHGQLYNCQGPGLSEEHRRAGQGADASEAAADANVRRKSHGQAQVLDEQCALP